MESSNNNKSKFGFTLNAENLNGRLAMLGFVAALLTELATGQGILHFWGLM
ncbi:MAG TPA: chlorophyll a/b-binding protein [Allocoleopsis sp.]